MDDHGQYTENAGSLDLISLDRPSQDPSKRKKPQSQLEKVDYPSSIQQVDDEAQNEGDIFSRDSQQRSMFQSRGQSRMQQPPDVNNIELTNFKQDDTSNNL